jgi:glycosylphosphatidylinositol diacylglycerol-lyase
MEDINSLAAVLQSHHHWNGRTWMWDARDAIGHLTIAQVAMVGTHNTATYEITRKSRFGRDGPKALRSNGALASLTRIFGGTFFPCWSKCQHMTVEEQLNFGVRYLDLRVAPYSTPSSVLYTTHGLLSTKLEGVLAAVQAFVANPATSHEFVLLDFQHIFLGPSDAGYATLIQYLTRMRGICVARPANGRGFPTLNELWKGRERVFIFMGCDGDFDRLPFVCPRDQFLLSPWLNKHNKKDLLCALDMSAAKLSTASTEKVFLTQAIITPDSSTVMAGTFSFGARPRSLRALAKHSNADFIQWFWHRNVTTNVSASSMHNNILLLDYPELTTVEVQWSGGSLRGSVVDICVGLNLLRGMQSKRKGREDKEVLPRKPKKNSYTEDEWSSAHP